MSFCNQLILYQGITNMAVVLDVEGQAPETASLKINSGK